MLKTPEKQIYYNEEVWVNPTTENMRRNECLCLLCSKMTYNKDANCPIAQQLYRICCNENIAFMMTRCKRYEAKADI